METTLNISGKDIVVDKSKLLKSRFAVFIIEFEYDNRLYIGHTTMFTVKSAIKKFINSVLDGSIKQNELLKESMERSQTLYVTVKLPAVYTLNALFHVKYKYILLNCCYEPFGFNKISLTGNKPDEEKECIRKLIKNIGDDYKKNVFTTNAKAIKEYAYIAGKGYQEIAKWPSITEAARHYNINSSNIVSCCNGRLHTAYGRIWRYCDN